MNSFWFCLALLVAGATVLCPAGQPILGLALIAAGILIAARVRDRWPIAPWPRELLGLLAPLALIAVMLPPSGRWACLLAALGLLGRLPARRRWLGAAAEACLGVGVAVAACAALAPVHQSLWARAPGWAPLTAAMQVVLLAMGWDARAWGGIVTFRSDDTVYQHALTADALLPYPLLCVAVIGSAMALGSPRDGRRLLRFAAALGLFCAARCLLLVRLTVEGFADDLFWDPRTMAISVLAVAPLLAAACPLDGGRQTDERRTTNDQRGMTNVQCPMSNVPAAPIGHWSLVIGHSPVVGRWSLVVRRSSFVVLVVATLLATILHAWTAAGVPKAGRVLIDESHSDWSRSLRPFDTAWFGIESTYNYASFGEYLSHFFRVAINERAPLTAELLRGCDVLVLKMPTRAFLAAERAAIDAFVRGGGGLWLIGDHTNVFGSSTYLNPISAPMGIRFREDAVWELTAGGPALWERDGAPAAHPVLRGLSRFEFQTGCSLQASLRAQDLMIAPRAVSRRADYGTPNFFPQAQRNTFTGAFGPALLAAAAHHGAGRVVAFTDSTSFSTFSMFATGRPEFAVNTVAWLNRRDRSPWPARAAALLALAAAAWFVVGARPEPHRSGRTLPAQARHDDRCRRWLVLCVALTTLLGGVVLAQILVTAAVPAPAVRPEAPLRRVYFLAAGSTGLFENLDPLHWSAADDPERDRRFTTFLVGTQRFGLVPAVVKSVPRYDPSGDLLVIAHPHALLPAVEAGRLEAFVREGGRVLVLPTRRSSRALDALLRPFGLRCAGRAAGEVTVTAPGARLRLRFRQPFYFHGGDALAHDPDGRGVLARMPYGRGLVLAAGDGQLFTNATLGNHFDVPSGFQRDATALQFWLFERELLRDREVARFYPAHGEASVRASRPPEPLPASGL